MVRQLIGKEILGFKVKGYKGNVNESERVLISECLGCGKVVRTKLNDDKASIVLCSCRRRFYIVEYRREKDVVDYDIIDRYTYKKIKDEYQKEKDSKEYIEYVREKMRER